MLVLTGCGSKKENNKKVENDKVNPEYVIVSKAYEGYTKWDFPSELNPTEEETNMVLYENINIPKITEESATINKINDEIYNKFEAYINSSKEKRPTGSKYGTAYNYEVTYEYKKYENIIYLVIKSSYQNYRDDIDGEEINYLEYIYDAENDQELTRKDICEKYNISLEKLNLEDDIDTLNIPLIPNDNGKFNLYYNNQIIEV